jgi:hypothetical protein
LGLLPACPSSDRWFHAKHLKCSQKKKSQSPIDPSPEERRASDQPSPYREDLANYLSIAIPELISPVDSARIRVNHQTAVLAGAAPAQIDPVTFENDVQRLLP